MSTALKCTSPMCVRCSKGGELVEPLVGPETDECHRLDITIVPILVGAINRETEARFGKVIAPFLAREDTFCVVSSDFCHW
jgi:predicted class III extradiol MEMO1 family dioxygenase